MAPSSIGSVDFFTFIFLLARFGGLFYFYFFIGQAQWTTARHIQSGYLQMLTEEIQKENIKYIYKIPSQMEVYHRAVALLGPHRTQRTHRPTANIDTQEKEKNTKKGGSSAKCKADRTLAFAPSALRPFHHFLHFGNFLVKVILDGPH